MVLSHETNMITVGYSPDLEYQLNKMSKDEFVQFIESQTRPSDAKRIDALSNLGINFKNGGFYWVSDTVSLPEALVDELYQKTQEDENPDVNYLLRFWLWSLKNPNPESRQSLFAHVKKYGMQLTEEGMIVVYRNVMVQSGASEDLINKMTRKFYELNRDNENPYDWVYLEEENEFVKQPGSSLQTVGEFVMQPSTEMTFSSSYDKKFRYQIGVPARLPREVCDESQATCSRGLHSAGASWLRQGYFGQVGLACLLNPMHVVSAPMADNYGKIRSCELLPIAFISYDANGNVVPFEVDQFSHEYGKVGLAQLRTGLSQVDVDPNTNYRLDDGLLTYAMAPTVDVIVPSHTYEQDDECGCNCEDYRQNGYCDDCELDEDDW